MEETPLLLARDGRQMEELARESGMRRASEEGLEGRAAFRERRRPRWAP